MDGETMVVSAAAEVFDFASLGQQMLRLRKETGMKYKARCEGCKKYFGVAHMTMRYCVGCAKNVRKNDF